MFSVVSGNPEQQQGGIFMKNTNKLSTKNMVLAAILTGIVVLLQFLGSFIKFGPFSISLVLIPIVIGTATCGKMIGAWLGLVFGIVVLVSGDAAPFLAVSVPGTIITVILKGIACGYVAGVVYKALESKNRTLAVAAAAVACPVVNTGVFLLGCFAFFMSAISEWAGGDIAKYIIFGLVGGNFLFELLLNLVISPAIVRILKYKVK